MSHQSKLPYRSSSDLGHNVAFAAEIFVAKRQEVVDHESFIPGRRDLQDLVDSVDEWQIELTNRE